MIRSVLLSSIIFIHSMSFAQTTEDEVFLPDLVSPAELSEEFNLPKAKSLWFDGQFYFFSLDEWSSRNGVDITQLYPIVIVVNKANRGTRAQTAQIYFDGKPYATYSISTGREKMEVSTSGKMYRSITPVGWFSPIYFSPNHYSKTWKAPMPWSIFFNGGIALHATTQNHYNELGRRASGGCVRLKYDDAKELYHLVKNAGKGSVPKFTQSGKLIRNSEGAIRYENNYKTLIIVENSDD